MATQIENVCKVLENSQLLKERYLQSKLCQFFKEHDYGNVDIPYFVKARNEVERVKKEGKLDYYCGMLLEASA